MADLSHQLQLSKSSLDALRDELNVVRPSVEVIFIVSHDLYHCHTGKAETLHYGREVHWIYERNRVANR